MKKRSRSATILVALMLCCWAGAVPAQAVPGSQSSAADDTMSTLDRLSQLAEKAAFAEAAGRVAEAQQRAGTAGRAGGAPAAAAPAAAGAPAVPAPPPAAGEGVVLIAGTRGDLAATVVGPNNYRAQVRRGDRLPSGGQVVAVEPGGVTVRGASGELVRLPFVAPGGGRRDGR